MQVLASRGASDPWRNRTVLVIDDEPRNIDLLEALLEPTGCRTLRAAGGAEALESYLATPPDLVLLDLMMPGVDGFEVLDRLRESRQSLHVPIIVVTAAAQREARLRALDLGADEFLDKPIDRAILLTRARTLLVLKATRDALDQRNAELQSLQEKQRELTAFLVHDLRNPLSVIRHTADWLLAELVDSDADIIDALGDVTRSAHRLNAMVSELLLVSRLETAPALCRTRLSLDELLSSIAREHEQEARARGVSLVAGARESAEVVGDAELLRRAFANLLENALRYTPAGGRIAMEAMQEPGHTCVAVSNTGAPIPEGERDRIFEKFRRAESRSRHVSVGLGLYFCRQVADSHGGAIEVESTSEWPVRFTFRIPRADPECP